MPAPSHDFTSSAWPLTKPFHVGLIHYRRLEPKAGNGETMEPFLAGAAGKALATIAASLGPRWASKLLLRWRVSRRASKRLEASGIEVASRSLRLWLARPDVQSQLIRGEQADIGTVRGRL